MRTDKKLTSQRVWAVRAGRDGEAHELFLVSGLIALADVHLGDLAILEPTRDAFYAAYRSLHPNDTRTGSAGIGGKYFRFVHEVHAGDVVVYPALPDKLVYVGTIRGSYCYSKSSAFPHQRSVEWMYVIPKADLSLGAQFELGAARTFFEFRKHVKELVEKASECSTSRFAQLPKVRSRSDKVHKR